MRVIFNRQKIAMGRKYYRQAVVIPIDHKEMCYTDFGMLIPLHSASTNFLDVLRKESTVEEFIAGGTAGCLVRVNAHSRVSLVDISCPDNLLHELPVTSLQWSTFGFYKDPSKASNAAYDFLISGCKTIESAIQRIDHSNAEGFYDPLVLDVAEVAQELKDLGCTKNFNTSYLDKVGLLVK